MICPRFLCLAVDQRLQIRIIQFRKAFQHFNIGKSSSCFITGQSLSGDPDLLCGLFLCHICGKPQIT